MTAAPNQGAQKATRRRVFVSHPRSPGSEDQVMCWQAASSHVAILSSLQNPLDWSSVVQLPASAVGTRAVFVSIA